MALSWGASPDTPTRNLQPQHRLRAKEIISMAEPSQPKPEDLPDHLREGIEKANERNRK